jgi:hypothetical protein
MLSSKKDRHTVRRIGIVASALLAASAAASSPALAAPATTPAWHIVKQVHSGTFGGFSAVVAVGKNGGWAFNQGSVPTAWRRSGSNWTQVRFPGKSNEVVAVARATSASNVWAFANNGTRSRALRWNGRDWTVAGAFPQEIGGAAVISPTDVWVFGEPFYPSAGLGAWHYNGHTWSRVTSGHGLEGGSALSADDIWAFDGSDVAHWNGHTWSRTSVAHLLPPKQALNGPAVTGVYAVSPHNVYAFGNGNLQDEGGPIVILHYNGHQWSKVAEGNYGFGTQPEQEASSDGHGGLWIPMPYASDGQRSYLLHYSAGHLTQAALPGGEYRMTVDDVALIPGTSALLGAGESHAYQNPGKAEVAVLLRYGI